MPQQIWLEDLDITPHKRRILKLRYENTPCKNIAQKYGVSEKTIEAHLYQIYKQYEVSSLIELAIKFGWLRVSPTVSDLIDSQRN